MTTETKEKKKRTPKNFESILMGALTLTFKDKVRLRDALLKAIDDDLEKIENELIAAKEIVNGKQH